MTPEQKQVYEWAKEQNFQSVAARYAKILAEMITDLMAQVEKVEKQRDAAQALLAEMSDVTGCNKISTCFGYPLEEVRELLEEHRRGKVHVFKFGLRSYVYRAWVHPSGNAAFITKHWMGTIQDLANAEMWDNAYATYKEAVDTLYDGK